MGRHMLHIWCCLAVWFLRYGRQTDRQRNSSVCFKLLTTHLSACLTCYDTHNTYMTLRQTADDGLVASYFERGAVGTNQTLSSLDEAFFVTYQ